MPDQHYPEPTVGALIFGPDDRVFLMKSHKWRGMYVIPGGHIELGERMEQALHREIAEETGLTIHDVRLLLHQEFIYDDHYWKPSHFIFFDFVCRTDSMDVTLNDEAEAYVWVSLDQALELPIDPYTVRTIEAYLAERQSAGHE